jgi:hypothetical protein
MIVPFYSGFGMTVAFPLQRDSGAGAARIRKKFRRLAFLL